MIKEHTLFTERFRPTDPKDYIGNEVFKSSLNLKSKVKYE